MKSIYHNFITFTKILFTIFVFSLPFYTLNSQPSGYCTVFPANVPSNYSYVYQYCYGGLYYGYIVNVKIIDSQTNSVVLNWSTGDDNCYTFTGQQANLFPGKTYLLYFSFYMPYSWYCQYILQYGYNSYCYGLAWLDRNINASFSDANEFLGVQTLSLSNWDAQNCTGTYGPFIINVPTNQQIGLTRLRVMHNMFGHYGHPGSNGCRLYYVYDYSPYYYYYYGYGEAEDYIINFTVPVTLSPTENKVKCGTAYTSFTASTSISAILFEWFKDADLVPDNGNEVLVQSSSSTTLAFTNVNYTMEGNYYVKAHFPDGSSANSNYAKLIVFPNHPTLTQILNRTNSSITLGWFNPSNCMYDGVLLVSSLLSNYDASIVPIDGVTYSASSNFGNPSSLIGPNHYVVFNGTGTSATTTNLQSNTYYRFRWFTYRNGNVYNPTYSTSFSSGNPRTVKTNPREIVGEENFVVGEGMELGDVIPNPVVSDELEFLLITSENGNYEVKILSANGVEEFRNTFSLSAGENILSISGDVIAGLASGVYILQISNGIDILNRQFVVIR
ncbi:MAG: T9SS type A sorting domain-containing protein [Ignavibacteria bacterium]|nr:T9SS type A sorting domain-containing protein [Ignavibacteria bacterium]